MKQGGGRGQSNPYTSFFLGDYIHVIKVPIYNVKKNAVVWKNTEPFAAVDLFNIQISSSHAQGPQLSQNHSSILSKFTQSHCILNIHITNFTLM